MSPRAHVPVRTPPRNRPASVPPGFVAADAPPLPAVLVDVPDAPDPVDDDDDEVKPSVTPTPETVIIRPSTPEQDELAAMRQQLAWLQAERDALAKKLAEQPPARGERLRSARDMNALSRRVRVLLRLRDQIVEIKDSDELAAPDDTARRADAAALLGAMAARGRAIWQREMDTRERTRQPSKMIEPVGVTLGPDGELRIIESVEGE